MVEDARSDPKGLDMHLLLLVLVNFPKRIQEEEKYSKFFQLLKASMAVHAPKGSQIRARKVILEG